MSHSIVSKRTRKENPFHDIIHLRDSEYEASLINKRRQLERSLRENFHKWNPTCQHLLDAMGDFLRQPSDATRRFCSWIPKNKTTWKLFRNQLRYFTLSDESAFSWMLFAADTPIYSYRGMDMVEEPTVTVDFATNESTPTAFRITTAHDERFTNGLQSDQLEEALRDLLQNAYRTLLHLRQAPHLRRLD